MNKNNILTTIAFIFVIAVVIFIGWKEVHRSKQKLEEIDNPKQITLASEYYVAPDAKQNQVPDNSWPLAIYAGDYIIGDSSTDIKYVTKRPPQTFPQRVVNLILKLNKIPEDTMPLRRNISKLIQKWKVKGSDITAIFIDYRPANPEFDKYNQFLYDLKRISDDFKYQTVNYHVSASLNKDWKDKYKEQYMLLKENTPIFLVEITEDELKSEDKIKSLKDLGVYFKVILPSNYEKIDFDRKLIKQNPLYANGMTTIDKDFVKPKEGIDIGIFPKFIENIINPKDQKKVEEQTAQ